MDLSAFEFFIYLRFFLSHSLDSNLRFLSLNDVRDGSIFFRTNLAPGLLRDAQRATRAEGGFFVDMVFLESSPLFLSMFASLVPPGPDGQRIELIGDIFLYVANLLDGSLCHVIGAPPVRLLYDVANERVRVFVSVCRDSNRGVPSHLRAAHARGLQAAASAPIVHQPIHHNVRGTVRARREVSSRSAFPPATTAELLALQQHERRSLRLLDGL
jgi:hypothetical protein